MAPTVTTPITPNPPLRSASSYSTLSRSTSSHPTSTRSLSLLTPPHSTLSLSSSSRLTPPYSTPSHSNPMTSSGPTDISSHAEFSGLMVVDTIFTPVPEKPKTVFISGAFYHGGTGVMGVFGYFNGPEYEFRPDSRWFVHTTVSQQCIFFLLSVTELDCRLLCLTRMPLPRRGLWLILRMSLISWRIFFM